MNQNRPGDCRRPCCCPPPPCPPPVYGGFTAVKLDEQTGAALPGAVYTLYQDGRPVQTAAADENGVLTFAGLPQGEYGLVETVPPQGYRQNQRVYSVTVDARGCVSIDGENAQGYPLWDLPAENLSPKPIILSVTQGDQFVTGTGVPGAELVVTLPDGTVITTTVTDSGYWVVPVPDGILLLAGQTVFARQTVPGFAPSENASFQVQAAG